MGGQCESGNRSAITFYTQRFTGSVSVGSYLYSASLKCDLKLQMCSGPDHLVSHRDHTDVDVVALFPLIILLELHKSNTNRCLTGYVVG